MQSFPTVLLIEDDRSIASTLKHALNTSYEVETVMSGAEAIRKSDLRDFDIIVLDLNLPDMSGLIVCQQLRNRGITAPILILTGDSRILSKISLLDAGANDYLTKPFSLGELKARFRALNRSIQPSLPQLTTLVAGGIELNRQTYEVYRDGVAINLRRREFALLECLMQHAGGVVSREMLTRSVWQDKTDVWTNTIEVHIKYLRDKIDRPFGDRLIRTVHGRGYKLENAHAVLSGKD